MSELLKSYIDEIDGSDFDTENSHNEIRALLDSYASKMAVHQDIQGPKFLQLESDIHNITKSINDGLIPLFEQKRILEDGRTIRIMQPDFSLYGKIEYDYFEKRYNESINLFLKVEYGLLRFLSNRLHHNNQKLELCAQLITLLKRYKAKLLDPNSVWAARSHIFHQRLLDVFLIMVRSGDSIQSELDSCVKLTESWFIDWPLNNEAFIFLCQFTAQNFVDCKKQVQQSISSTNILKKFDEAIAFFLTQDMRSAILTSEKALFFCATYKPNDKSKYSLKLAEFYEGQGDLLSQGENPFSSIKDYEEALKYYNSAKNTIGIERVSKKFEIDKAKFKPATISVQTDENESRAITDLIKQVIDSGSSDLIIRFLCGYNIIKSGATLIAEAKKAANSNSLLNFARLQSMDKYGNTIRIYSTEEEREFFHLSRILGTSHQIGLQITFQILIHSLHKGTISYSTVKSKLENSWLNEPLEWLRNGEPHSTVLLNAVLPGLDNLFFELGQWAKDSSYKPNFILCSDSMATKVEMILRYMCKTVGIPTFRYDEQRGVILTDEKPLGKLLESLENILLVDDVLIINHLINEKGGLNIRNHIAHGLMDADEYSATIPLTLLSIILRLSEYRLTNKQS
jgi:hypothetical protein